MVFWYGITNWLTVLNGTRRVFNNNINLKSHDVNAGNWGGVHLFPGGVSDCDCGGILSFYKDCFLEIEISEPNSVEPNSNWFSYIKG